MGREAEFKAMDNPYWLSLVEPKLDYWCRILSFAGIFAALFIFVERWASARASSGNTVLQAVSSPRLERNAGPEDRSALSVATNVCSFVHALVTGGGAVWAVLRLWTGDPDGLASNAWQWCLAFSQGYFLADAMLYGTRREAWVLIHHSWMIIAHHPIGEPTQTCRLMGVGDCSLAIWLSCTGYWAEISTVFLVIRWFQIKLLKHHSVWYTVNSAFLLLTYPVTRVGVAVAILVGSLWPRYAEYERQGLTSLVTFTTVTYVAMALMSTFFYYTLVSRGLARALYFTPSEAKKK